MDVADRKAATAVLQAVLVALLASGGNRAGQQGAELRRLVGALSTAAGDLVEISGYGKDLRACFEAATNAGATFAGMEKAWIAASGFASTRGPVQQAAQTSIRFALVEMCRILSATAFTSRQDVDAALARINADFEPAEEFAADQRDNVVWRAIVALHAAAVRDLTARAKQLPRLITYTLPRRLPALALSNRLYGDASRCAELVAENRVVHPLFMAGTGRALAT